MTGHRGSALYGAGAMEEYFLLIFNTSSDELKEQTGKSLPTLKEISSKSRVLDRISD